MRGTNNEFKRPGMGSVVTYQLAYRSDAKISLCARHAATPENPLGPVQHGRHYGQCAECAREAEERRIVKLGVSA